MTRIRHTIIKTDSLSVVMLVYIKQFVVHYILQLRIFRTTLRVSTLRRTILLLNKCFYIVTKRTILCDFNRYSLQEKPRLFICKYRSKNKLVLKPIPFNANLIIPFSHFYGYIYFLSTFLSIGNCYQF